VKLNGATDLPNREEKSRLFDHGYYGDADEIADYF